jgi:hypothetical protein
VLVLAASRDSTARAWIRRSGRRHGSPTRCPTPSWGWRALPSPLVRRLPRAWAVGVLVVGTGPRRRAQAPAGGAAGLVRLRRPDRGRELWRPRDRGDDARFRAVLVSARPRRRRSSARARSRSPSPLALTWRPSDVFAGFFVAVSGSPGGRGAAASGRSARPRASRLWWLVGPGAAGALGAAPAWRGRGRIACILPNARRRSSVPGAAALAVVIVGTVILASTPATGPRVAGPGWAGLHRGRHDPIASA